MMDPELELNSNNGLTKSKIIIFSHINVVKFIGPCQVLEFSLLYPTSSELPTGFLNIYK